jgi:dTDP-4-dehydrorhamnose reductase
MQPLKILLIGKQGQVGQALQSVLAPLGELTCWGRETLDLLQPDTLVPAITPVQPNVIINAAAYTAVDRAEQEPELAFCLNHEAPRQLAIAAQASDATLIHLSTDYVFNGQQNRPYLETDGTDPLGVYGRSKRAGEQAIQESCDHHVILRTAWVYSPSDKPNFVKTMLRLGKERQEIRVVYDQVGSPTGANVIAQTIASLIPLLKTVSPGIYHCTNSGVASWYDFAIAIFEDVQELGNPVGNLGKSLAVERVIPITTAEYPTPAQRPAYSVLNCGKISQLLGFPAPHWRQTLRQNLLQILKTFL